MNEERVSNADCWWCEFEVVRLEYAVTMEGHLDWWCECDRCGASGPHCRRREEAALEWNRGPEARRIAALSDLKT